MGQEPKECFPGFRFFQRVQDGCWCFWVHATFTIIQGPCKAVDGQACEVLLVFWKIGQFLKDTNRTPFTRFSNGLAGHAVTKNAGGCQLIRGSGAGETGFFDAVSV